MTSKAPLVAGSDGLPQQLQSADALATAAGVAYQLKDEKDAASGYVGLTSAMRAVISPNAYANGSQGLRVSGSINTDGFMPSSWYVTGNYTFIGDSAGGADYTVFCNSSTTITITLPTYAGSGDGLTSRGRVCFIRGLGTGPITLALPSGDAAAGVLIEGATTLNLPAGVAIGIQFVSELGTRRWRIVTINNHWFTATDKLLCRSTAGAGLGEEATLTSVARTLIAQTTQSSMLTTGLGAGATGSNIFAASTAAAVKTLLAIAASDVSGLAAVATSGSASDLGAGTLPLGRLSGITDAEISASAGIALSKLAAQATLTLCGNNTGGSAVPTALTAAQVKTLLAIAASDVSGLATVATSGSASDLGSGTLPLARLASITDAQMAAANKDGGQGIYSLRSLGVGSQQAAAGDDTRFLAGLDIDSRVFRSRCPTHATPFLLVSGVAYFVYLGRVSFVMIPKFVEFYLSSLATGNTEVGEVGLFSTPSAPNKAAQSLTKLVASGTVDTVKVGLGVKRNTSAFATPVSAGVHLWAGVRYAMASGTVAQPTMVSLGYDFAQGNILSLASAGVLTGTGPFAGGIIAASTTQVCPDLRVTLD